MNVRDLARSILYGGKKTGLDVLNKVSGVLDAIPPSVELSPGPVDNIAFAGLAGANKLIKGLTQANNVKNVVTGSRKALPILEQMGRGKANYLPKSLYRTPTVGKFEIAKLDSAGNTIQTNTYGSDLMAGAQLKKIPLGQGEQLAPVNNVTPYADTLRKRIAELTKRGADTTNAEKQLAKELQVGKPNTVVDNTLKEVQKYKSVEELATDVQKRLGLKDLYLYETKQGDLKLDSIIVPKELQGQGVGSKAMQEITDYADSNGKRMVLNTAIKDDLHGTTSKKRLIEFYKRFGFVENKGRNTDHTVTGGMIRNPKSQLTDIYNQAIKKSKK